MMRQDDPRLRCNANLGIARDLLQAHVPPNAEQAETRRRMLDLIARHPRTAHRRECLEGHLTASALVVDAGGERVLLTHHKKLGRWLQLGGHCDGDANLPGVALREAVEEGGIADLRIDPAILDLDIHPIPEHGAVPGHLHYDVRFLVRAPPGAEPVVSEESHDVQWVGVEEALELVEDVSLRRMLRDWQARRGG